MCEPIPKRGSGCRRRRWSWPIPRPPLMSRAKAEAIVTSMLPPPLSIYEPMHLGIDENGDPVRVTLMYRNLLCAGEPGAGKSSALNIIVGTGRFPRTAGSGFSTANASN